VLLLVKSSSSSIYLSIFLNNKLKGKTQHKATHIKMSLPSYGAVPTQQQQQQQPHNHDPDGDEEDEGRGIFSLLHSADDNHREGMSSSATTSTSTSTTAAKLSVRFSQRMSERLFTPLVRTVSEGMQTLAHPTFVLSDAALDLDENRRKHFRMAGTSSIASEVANLSKNTIGGGVMSLSGGIALYANDPQAVLSATLWIVGLGVLFGYFCLLTGKSCDMSLSATYRECWERTVGSSLGGLAVAIATTLDPLMGLFANSSILSQSLQFTLEGVLGIYWTIPQCLIIIATFALLPLCLMRNLDALAPFSVFGMAAVFTALGCMVIRYLDGSYLPGGTYHEAISPEYRPEFGTRLEQPFSFAAMPFVCMAFTSFDMHYNSPRYYTELKNATVPRFAKVCGASFGIVSFLYLSIAAVGYLTFGGVSHSFILNNYAPTDNLATLARVSMGFSAMLTYPLNFMGLRDNCLDLLGLTDQFNQTLPKLRVFIVILLGTCVTMACFVTDLGFISSVGGGTSVALVAFVFPAIMFQSAVRQQHDGTKDNIWFLEQAEVWFVLLSMISMVIIGLCGVVASIELGA
jgi:sodium-coupled neutral amino acid transporter 11